MKRYGLFVDGRDGVEIHDVDGDWERAMEAGKEMARDLDRTYAREGYELSVRSDMGLGAIHMEWVRSDRVCKVCGKRMWQGYCIDDGAKYFCSDDCLLQEMTQEEYDELFEEDAAYWTEWDADDCGDYIEVLIEPGELDERGRFVPVEYED